jgi:hypothetical protein
MNDERELDEHLPEPIRNAAGAYHEPPATPREEIWAGIQARRGGRVDGVIPIGSAKMGRRSAGRWAAWITGIAAALILGIGIGRFGVPDSQRQSVPGPVASEGPAMGGAAFDLAATQHFSRVETFLISLRTSPGEVSFSTQARDLLLSTRLLLDAPGARDTRLRALLEDLELILVQIAQLDRRSTGEIDLITEGLEERQVLPRLQSAIPAGSARL